MIWSTVRFENNLQFILWQENNPSISILTVRMDQIVFNDCLVQSIAVVYMRKNPNVNVPT